MHVAPDVYVPGRQLVHTADDTAATRPLNVPEPHAVHAADAVAPTAPLCVPAAQPVQPDAPAAAL